MFMVSACVFGVVFFHPASPVAAIDIGVRTVLMGFAMGLTAIGIICSPWGKRSGAHFNPAVTLAFFRLGKINRDDACFYVLFQTIGGTGGVLIASFFLGDLLADSSVNFVITIPGSYRGCRGIRSGGHYLVLNDDNDPFYQQLAAVVTLYTVPRRSFCGTFHRHRIADVGNEYEPRKKRFSSAIVSGNWTAAWIYFLAPPVAMLTAAEFFVRTRGIKNVLCAKLNHFGRVSLHFQL